MNTLPTSARWSTLPLLVVMLECVGCGPSEFQKDFQQWQVDTKTEHKAADVQIALSPFFAENGTLTNRLPDRITSLPIFAEDPTGVEVARSDCADGLLLLIGSGFGHWGLLVVRPEDEDDICGWHRARATPWADGVYFFRE